MAKSKAPTNIKAEQQARQLNYVHDSLNKEVVSQLIVDQYYNKLKDIGDGFRGTVLGFKEVSVIGDPDALREGKRFSSYVYTENGIGTHQDALEGGRPDLGSSLEAAQSHGVYDQQRRKQKRIQKRFSEN